mgnify:CR=1 FL=1
MQYKLLAIDLDGTLLNRAKKIHKNDLDAIKFFISLGGQIIISTGRHYRACEQYVKQIENYTKAIIPYVITLNGAEIYNSKREIVYTKFIDKSIVTEINKVLQENRIYYFAYPVAKDQNDDKTPIANSKLVQKFSAVKYAVRPTYINSYYNEDVYKLNIMSFSRRRLVKTKNILIDKFGDKINIFYHNGYFYEISPIEVNKGEAINYVANKLHIPLNKTAVCGDTGNDIDGFRVCKLSAAVRTRNKNVVANASVHIKKSKAAVAKFITDHVIQDLPKVKMVVTDLDGTFYTDVEKNIVQEAKEVINSVVPKDIKYFCVCSGRSAADTFRAIESLGVKKHKNLFIIGVNGAAVYDVEHYKQIYAKWLKRKDVKRLFDIYAEMSKKVKSGMIIHNYDKAKTQEAMRTCGEVIPKMYCKNKPFIITQLKQLSKHFFTKYNRIENYHELEGCPSWLKVSKIIFQFDSPETRNKMWTKIQAMHLPLFVSASVGKNIEFNNPTINKSVGLKKLCKYLGIKPNETLVCGDELNDTPMMKLTEWSYCFAKCRQEVKDSCKFVLDSKPSYMVADAIKDYIKTTKTKIIK